MYIYVLVMLVYQFSVSLDLTDLTHVRLILA